MEQSESQGASYKEKHGNLSSQWDLDVSQAPGAEDWRVEDRASSILDEHRHLDEFQERNASMRPNWAQSAVSERGIAQIH